MKRNSSSRRREEMQSVSSSSTTLLSSSPSLTCCPSGGRTLAEIAVRVARELSLQEDGLEGYVHDAEESFFHNSEAELSHLDDEEEEEEEEEEEQQQQQEAEDYDDRDEDFEFTFVCGVPGSSPVSADEIFHNGQIRPMYKYASLINLGCPPRTESTREDYWKQRPRRPPLKLLMSEDDRRTGEPPEPGFSCSSEELEGAAPGTYCVWVPREALGKPCGKSSSTGSDSWRWKLKHLLLLLQNRSNSDGTRDVPSALPATGAEGHHAAVCEGAKPGAVTTESHDVGRRPYLLYRTDLVSFFTNINGLGRNLHPFR